MKLTWSIVRGTSTAVGAAIILFHIYDLIEGKLISRKAGNV